MPKRDIVVIGASAGGVEALKEVVSGLPPGLEAALFITLHIGRGPSQLPAILSRSGPLPAIHPQHGQAIQHGRIYIAPPDFHMVLSENHIHLSHGPRENRTRPAINPLFRSAALNYGERVTGVILTGLLDDGVAGLAEVKRHGGAAIVEDPKSALYPSMPINAIRRVDVDHLVGVTHVAGAICRLAAEDLSFRRRDETMTKRLTSLTCPECRGPLSEERQGQIVEYSCRVGHRYTPLAMESEHRDTVERSLWASVVALEEAADIIEKLSLELGPDAIDDARKKREQAANLRRMLDPPQDEPLGDE